MVECDCSIVDGINGINSIYRNNDGSGYGCGCLCAYGNSEGDGYGTPCDELFCRSTAERTTGAGYDCELDGNGFIDEMFFEKDIIACQVNEFVIWHMTTELSK